MAFWPVYKVSKIIMFSLKVIDYLCVVGKLTDKGHNSLLVEETLILFKNNSEKVCFLIHLIRLQTFLIYILKKNQFYLLGLLGLNYHSIGRLKGIYSQQIFVCWWIFVHSAPPFISGEWRRPKKKITLACKETGG